VLNPFLKEGILMTELKAIYYINQFYAGLGGEELAHSGLQVFEHAKGPGLGLEPMWQGQMKIVRTLACGDNYINIEENFAALKPQLKQLIEEVKPDVVIAGPAFNAGRYGVACAKICDFVRGELSIPAVCSMFPQNPAVPMYGRENYITVAAETAAGMRQSLPPLAALALKLARRESIGTAAAEGYIPTGYRRNELDEKSAAQRVVDMLVKKLKNELYRTEVPLRKDEQVEAAPPLSTTASIKIGFITTGGLVPKGNPDKLRQFDSVSYGTYQIEQDTFNAANYESIHGGYDTTIVNQDPQRLIPYNAALQLKSRGLIGEVASYFLSTAGIGTNVNMSRTLGADMAKQLAADGVGAVFLTST
jgi:glycine reductase